MENTAFFFFKTESQLTDYYPRNSSAKFMCCVEFLFRKFDFYHVIISPRIAKVNALNESAFLIFVIKSLTTVYLTGRLRFDPVQDISINIFLDYPCVTSGQLYANIFFLSIKLTHTDTDCCRQ